ncbi:MAG: ATP-binding protein [Terriglobia bacterium]
MSRDKSATQTEFQFTFGSGFLHDHAGQIIDDPRVAIIELVANCYDAGANEVIVEWPTAPGKVLSIKDNGTGMTRLELERRWMTLAYDRPAEQGTEVVFPPDIPKAKRTAFGHNGKGRFSPFCFGDEYRIETWRDGTCVRALVQMTQGVRGPFVFRLEDEFHRTGHGTKISLAAERAVAVLPDSHIRDWIGYRFAVDPSFEVIVNGQGVELLSLKHRLTTRSVDVEGQGKVELHRLDPQKQERTMHLKGIAWWVNKRMVGEPSWEGLDGEGQYLDGRTAEAKRFSFVVEADILKPETNTDWSGFKQTPKLEAVRKAVHRAVVEELHGLMADDRKAAKKAAIQQHRGLIRQLSGISQWQIGRFVEEALDRCPTITTRELSRTVEIWGKLEQSRSGYDLLKQLAACSPEDLDTWDSLMQKWTASNAEVVLSELERRLAVIKQLQELVRDRNSDEVHDLQPVFERGLWIFGPEYESVEFTSNRGMTHVVQDFFALKGVTASRKRPDFVALPDSSIGLYSADDFRDGEVSGVRKVLIVELKRGGFHLTLKELDQARGYALELRAKGCVQPSTKIEAFVLGASLEQGLVEMTMGPQTVIRPFPYDLLLSVAHARVFNLSKKIKETAPALHEDTEIADILKEPSLEDAFDQAPTAPTGGPES